LHQKSFPHTGLPLIFRHFATVGRSWPDAGLRPGPVTISNEISDLLFGYFRLLIIWRARAMPSSLGRAKRRPPLAEKPYPPPTSGGPVSAITDHLPAAIFLASDRCTKSTLGLRRDDRPKWVACRRSQPYEVHAAHANCIRLYPASFCLSPES
jgi:hypothetical protein